MRIRQLILIFGIGTLICCGSRSADTENIQVKDSTIVFFDIDGYSRGQLSNLISHLNTFHPKVIGLNSVLEEWHGNREDSLLAKSIYEASRIILLVYEDVNKEVYVKSHRYFSKAATGEGVSSYLDDDNGTTTGYIPLLQIREGQMINFAELILYNYSDEAEKRFYKLRVNQSSKIQFNKTLDNFVILNEADLKRDDVEGKIVLLGDVDISKDNTSLIVGKNGEVAEVPNIVIVANIILTGLLKSE